MKHVFDCSKVFLVLSTEKMQKHFEIMFKIISKSKACAGFFSCVASFDGIPMNAFEVASLLIG